MVEIATAWVTLAVSASGMQRDIRKAFRDVDADGAGHKAGKDFSKGATDSTNLTGIEAKMVEAGQRGAAALQKALKRGAIAAGAAVGAAVGTSLKLGFDRLKAIDDAKAKLRGLGNDAGTVAKVMDNALASVQGTAFGLGDAAGLAGVIVASGIKPGQELETTLKRVADTAAISGSSLSEMGLIWGKVAAKNKLDGQAVNQLLEHQIPIYDILGKKLGKNAEEIADMVKDGEINFQIFSDAMADKVAGAALRTGETVSGSFANMKAAMGRFGAAVEDPLFKRLPGAFTNLTKRIDEATPAAKAFAEQFNTRMFDSWIPKAKQVWEQLRTDSGVRSTLSEVRSIFASLAETARQAWPAVAQIGQSLGAASKSLGVSSWRLFVTTLEAAAGILNTLVGPLKVVADLMKKHQGVVTAAAAAWLAFRTVPALLGRITPATTAAAAAVSTLGQRVAAAGTGVASLAGAYRTSLGWVRQANPSISTAGAHMAVLGANVRAAATGGFNLLKGAAGGVIGALGGPFSAALIGTGVAFSVISAKNQQASQSLQAYDTAVRNTNKSQTALNEALMGSRGAFDDTVKTAAVDRVKAISDELETASQRTGSFLDQFRDADHSLWGGFRKQIFSFGDNPEKNYNTAIREQADAARDAITALDGLKLTQQSLADVTYGSQAAFDALVAKLDAAGDGGHKAAEQLRAARREMQQQQEVARNAAPGIDAMAKAMRILADNTASAADKSNALKTALDALNPARTKGDAIAAHDKVLQQVAQSTQEATDQTKGFGEALLSSDTGINTATQNGQSLREALLSLVDASTQAVAAGQNLDEVNSKNATAMQQLASAYGLTVPQIKAAFDELGGKDVEMIRMAASSSAVVQSLGLVARAFEALPDKAEIPFNATQIQGAETQLDALGIKVEQISDKPGYVNVIAKTDDAKQRLQAIGNLLASDAIPADKPINVTAPGGKEVFDLLVAMGEKVGTDNDKNIDVKAPLGQQTLALLEQLGVKVRQDNDKLIAVKTSGVEQAKLDIAELTKPENKIIRMNMVRQAFGAEPVPAPPPGRVDGAIVPMVDGGLRHIIKPSDAGIYAGRGAGTIFAEQETGGEAYIPLAAGKRGRSTAILAEVARLFGLGLTRMDSGGITVDMLKQYAAGISGQPYAWGQGDGDTFSTDCSGAQATLANFITGGTGRFGTASEAAGLLARGFQMGDPPEGVTAYWVGWRNGGPGGGHTAGTIVDPEGGNVNVEMGGKSGGGQFGGSAAGAADFPQRAWIALAGGDDPTKSNSGGAAVHAASARVTSAKAAVTSAQASLDQANADLDKATAEGASQKKIDTARKKRDAAEQRLTAAQERQTAAEMKLTEVKEKEAAGSKKASGPDGKQIGQMIMSGMMETIGLDGSLFSNPFEWPNVKSAMVAANFGAGMLQNAMGGGSDDGSKGPGAAKGGGGKLPGIKLPGVKDFVKPKDGAHAGNGAAPGPGVTFNTNITGNIGMDPKAVTGQLNNSQNNAVRRHLGGRG